MAHIEKSHELNCAIRLREVAQLSHFRGGTLLNEQGETWQENNAYPKLGRIDSQAVQFSSLH